MNIKDLEVSKELNQEERIAVRGGSVFIIPTSQAALGGGFASPITQVSSPVAVDASSHTKADLTNQNVLAIDSLVAQFKV